jgi:hypothetical protein
LENEWEGDADLYDKLFEADVPFFMPVAAVVSHTGVYPEFLSRTYLA